MSVFTLQILSEKGDKISPHQHLGATRLGVTEELGIISKLIVAGVPDFDEPSVLVQLLEQLPCAR